MKKNEKISGSFNINVLDLSVDKFLNLLNTISEEEKEIVINSKQYTRLQEAKEQNKTTLEVIVLLLLLIEDLEHVIKYKGLFTIENVFNSQDSHES